MEKNICKYIMDSQLPCLIMEVAMVHPHLEWDLEVNGNGVLNRFPRCKSTKGYRKDTPKLSTCLFKKEKNMQLGIYSYI